MQQEWIERLDTILIYMKEHQHEAVLGWPDQVAEKAGLSVERTEAYRMHSYLRRLGYLHPLNETGITMYTITFEGIVFIENGGFAEQQRIRSKEAVKFDLDLEMLANSVSDYSTIKWQAKWAFRITILSVVIALIALILQWTGKK